MGVPNSFFQDLVMWGFFSILSILLLSVFQGTNAQGCDPNIYVDKPHSWNKGYTAKLYLDQSWLTQQTSDWKLNITFKQEVAEFKVWDAVILDPATSNSYVNNVTMTTVMNKCWNPILYPCQYLELSFMVRFPEVCSSGEFSTEYDIVSVTESVTYNDGSSGANEYCGPQDGQPTTPAVGSGTGPQDGQPTTPAVGSG